MKKRPKILLQGMKATLLIEKNSQQIIVPDKKFKLQQQGIKKRRRYEEGILTNQWQ